MEKQEYKFKIFSRSREEDVKSRIGNCACWVEVNLNYVDGQ